MKMAELSDEQLSHYITENLTMTHHDMVNDPAMTLLLLNKLHEYGNVVLCGDNGWGVTVYFIDENGTTTTYVRPDMTNSRTPGRAIAQAWAFAEYLRSGIIISL